MSAARRKRDQRLQIGQAKTVLALLCALPKCGRKHRATLQRRRWRQDCFQHLSTAVPRMGVPSNVRHETVHTNSTEAGAHYDFPI